MPTGRGRRFGRFHFPPWLIRTTCRCRRTSETYLPNVYTASGNGGQRIVVETDVAYFQQLQAQLSNPGCPVHGLVAYDGSVTSVLNGQGNWANSTSYTVGQHVADATDGSNWVCQTANTSAAPDTSFSSDRGSHPTYWRQVAENHYVMVLAPTPASVIAFLLDYTRVAPTMVNANDLSGLPPAWMPAWLDGAIALTLGDTDKEKAAAAAFSRCPAWIMGNKEPIARTFTGSPKTLHANTTLWQRIGRGFGGTLTPRRY